METDGCMSASEDFWVMHLSISGCVCSSTYLQVSTVATLVVEASRFLAATAKLPKGTLKNL